MKQFGRCSQQNAELFYHFVEKRSVYMGFLQHLQNEKNKEGSEVQSRAQDKGQTKRQHETMGAGPVARGALRRRTSRSLRALLLAAGLTLFAAGSAFAEENAGAVFIPGTNINGYHVGGQTVDGAIESVSNQNSANFTFVVLEKDGKQETISGSDIGLYKRMDKAAVQAILDAQQANGGAFGMNASWQNTVAETAGYDEAKLNARLDSLDCFTKQQPTTNAHISAYQEGQPFTIVPETEGNSLNVEAAKQAIRDAISRAETSIDLNAIGVYDQVSIDRNNEALKKLCGQMNQAVNQTITYDIYGNQEVLPGSTIATWLTGSDADGQMGVDTAKVQAFVQGLADKYDTAGKAHTFTGGAGVPVTMTSDYGWKLDVAGETAALTDAIRGGQSVTRQPVWAKTAAAAAPQDFGNTFVEVDMARQHVYYFQDGQVVWDAPCVTGNLSKKYDTPAGIYSIYSKERNRVLRGKKLANGKYEYESPVDFWMPFNGGVGLHDANWRGSFGGSIYKTSGSHGCVNLPPSKVPALYELVKVGTIVVCHN